MIGPFPRDEFLGLHERLALTPGPSNGEGPRRDVLRQFLVGRGLEAEADAAGNLVVTLGPAAPWAETVVLDAHLDVVERGHAVQVLRLADGLQGLGVGDNLAAVGMLALALTRLDAAALRRPLLALFSVGEEGLGNLRGIRHLVTQHAEPPRILVSFDGSAESYSMTGLGSRRYHLAVTCPGGHSWSSFGSPNAIEVLLEALTAIKARYHEARYAASTVLSFNLGTIAGGEGINSIARNAEATFEFRSVSEVLLRAMDSVARGVAEATGQPADVTSTLACIGERPAAVAVDADRVAALVLPAWEPVSERLVEKPMSTNINPALAAGWPAICVGLCSVRHTHREDETVQLSSLAPGWGCLDRLCERLLG